jgi:hypothetical protein
MLVEKSSMEVITQAGISWRLACIWSGGREAWAML